MPKSIELFTTENSNILRHLSEFITKAFERRGQKGLYSIENSTYISYLAYYIFSRALIFLL